MWLNLGGSNFLQKTKKTLNSGTTSPASAANWYYLSFIQNACNKSLMTHVAELSDKKNELEIQLATTAAKL